MKKFLAIFAAVFLNAAAWAGIFAPGTGSSSGNTTNSAAFVAGVMATNNAATAGTATNGFAGLFLQLTNGTLQYQGTSLYSAYTNEIANSGSTLLLGSGPFNAITISNANLTWIGLAKPQWIQTSATAGYMAGGTIITNGPSVNGTGMVIQNGASNLLFANIGFEATNLSLAINIPATNPANIFFKNCGFGDPSHISTHTVYVSGNGNRFEDCYARNGWGHGFAVLGSPNTVFKNCESFGNTIDSWILKSDTNQWAASSGYGNVRLIDCSGDNSIYFQAFTAALTNVTVDNFVLNNSAAYITASPTLWMEADPGCLLKDVKVNNFEGFGHKITDMVTVVVIDGAGGTFTNIIVQNSTLDNSGYAACALYTTGGSIPDIGQFHLSGNRVNGALQVMGGMTVDSLTVTNLVLNGNTNFSAVSGLIGWWRFCGDYFNYAGPGNTGTNYGTTFTYGVGQSAAVSFTNGSAIDLGKIPLTNLTVAAWVRPMGAARADYIASWNGVSQQYLLTSGTYSGVFSLFVSGTGSDLQHVDSTTTFVVGKWYHLVGTYDGTTEYIYINGNQEAGQGFGETLFNSTTTNYIGASAAGMVSDLKIFNRALSATEVKQLYNNGVGVKN